MTGASSGNSSTLSFSLVSRSARGSLTTQRAFARAFEQQRRRVVGEVEGWVLAHQHGVVAGGGARQGAAGHDRRGAVGARAEHRGGAGDQGRTVEAQGVGAADVDGVAAAAGGLDERERGVGRGVDPWPGRP